MVFKDDAVKTGVESLRALVGLYRPKALFDRALGSILRVELRPGVAAVVAAGPQRFEVRRHNPALRRPRRRAAHLLR